MRRFSAALALLICGIGLSAAFENCSSPLFLSNGGTSAAVSGGTGIDGKPYVSYGACLSGQIDVVSAITVSASDGKSSAWQTRNDCQDLAAPKMLDATSLSYSLLSNEMFQFNGRIFDQHKIASQKITLQSCRSADGLNEVRLWQWLGYPALTYASLKDSTGFELTDLSVVSDGAVVPTFRSLPNQSGALTLSFSGMSLDATYSSGAVSGARANLNCLMQTAPTSISPATSGLSAPSGYSPAQLVFEDRFLTGQLDSSKWIPQIADQNGVWRKSVPAPYSAADSGSYNAEFYDPNHVLTGSGLKLVARRDSTFTDYQWRSGCITTHGKFSFQGGYAQFRAKLPDSRSGPWASIWFLEGGAEIDLQSSGYLGGADANHSMFSHLHSGANTQSLMPLAIDLSADYHVYGMEYVPGVSVKTFLDGNLMAHYTQNVPSGAMTIVINLAIAQGTSPWHTTLSPLTPAVVDFDVSDVQVYRLTP